MTDDIWKVIILLVGLLFGTGVLITLNYARNATKKVIS